MGHQAGDRLGGHEADVQRRAEREGPAEVLGRVAVAARPMIMAVMVVMAVARRVVMPMIVVVIMIGVIVGGIGVVVRHAAFIPPRARRINRRQAGAVLIRSAWPLTGPPGTQGLGRTGQARWSRLTSSGSPRPSRRRR
jgi:hypothetical protein